MDKVQYVKMVNWSVVGIFKEFVCQVEFWLVVYVYEKGDDDDFLVILVKLVEILCSLLYKGVILLDKVFYELV